MSDTHRFKVDLLDGENYSTWAFKMEAILELKNVWQTITGTRPETMTEADWIEKGKTARILIALHVENKETVHIKSCLDGKSAWEALKAVHQRNTAGTQLRIMRNLTSIRIKPEDNMREHLDKLAQWRDELSELGEPLKQKFACALILGSVYHSYGNLVTAIESWDEDKMTIANIRGALIEEWEKRKSEAESDTTIRALEANRSHQHRLPIRDRLGSLPVRNQGRTHSPSWTSRDGYLCHTCRKPGHIRRDCPMGRRPIATSREVREYGQSVASKIVDPKFSSEENKESEQSAFLTRLSQWYSESFSSNFSYYSNNLKRNTNIANNDSDVWCIDSGATQHMCNNINCFDVLEKYYGTITVANGDQVPVMGKGTVQLLLNTDGKTLEITLNDVLYIPKLSDNLISVQRLASKGFTIVFKGKVCQISIGNDTCTIGNNYNGLYLLSVIGKSLVVKGRCIHEWHKSLAHRNFNDIRGMKNNIKIIKCDHSDVCEPCIRGKMSKLPFHKSKSTTKKCFDLVVSDVCGPMQTESMGRNKYFVTFVDAHTRYVDVVFVREKSQVAQEVIKYIERLKTQFDKKPKTFRTDRGLEYLNERLKNYFEKEGIKHECTVGYAPEQNGMAERMNRTLIESAKTMLFASNLPNFLWAEAVNYASYAYNRIPTSMTKISPYEGIFKKKPDMNVLHDFGCDVYTQIPDVKRRKLDEKAEKMKFIGRDYNSKGYRLIDRNFKFHISREVKFLETNKPFETTIVPVEKSRQQYLYVDTSYSPMIEENDSSRFFDALEEITPEVQEEVEPARRSARSNIGQPPNRYGDYVSYKINAEDENFEPKTYNEAISCKHSNEWNQAIQEELNSLEEKCTWEISSLPSNRSTIGCKWLFKNKCDETGSIARRKARLVAQGFSQKYGVDYDEVFAPVARSTTLRLLLSIAGKRKYDVYQYDVKTAFLNGKLEEEIYMRFPQGIKTLPGKVLHLKKSIYGLKQAARAWNSALNEVLTKYNCIQNQTDKCLYTCRENEKICYIIIHVDDILIATNNYNFMSSLMNSVGKHFELKNLGGVKHYLGIDITRENNKFFISQPRYIDKIVTEAGQQNAKGSKHPLDTGYYNNEGKPLKSNEEYRKLIGMLLYLSTNTRPDIAVSVGILSQKVQTPSDYDLNEVRRVIKYLKSTQHLKLQLNDDGTQESMIPYSDASWAEDKVDRKSISGFYCLANGGVITWYSRKQDVCAGSSCEAEYVALSEACKEVTWLREVARAFDMKVPECTIVYTDSQSSISLVENQKFSHRTKHIDVKYHYARDLKAKGRIDLKYVPTGENIADMLTKPLNSTKIKKLRMLGKMIDVNEEIKEE